MLHRDCNRAARSGVHKTQCYRVPVHFLLSSVVFFRSLVGAVLALHFRWLCSPSSLALPAPQRYETHLLCDENCRTPACTRCSISGSRSTRSASDSLLLVLHVFPDKHIVLPDRQHLSYYFNCFAGDAFISAPYRARNSIWQRVLFVHPPAATHNAEPAQLKMVQTAVVSMRW